MSYWWVGFFTARNYEMDEREIGNCNVVLQKYKVKASTNGEAVGKAKNLVDMEALKSELTRRWPNAKFVAYTTQKVGKYQSNSWMRSFNHWRIIE